MISLGVHTYDASNKEQQIAIDLVKDWKAKQNSYNNVLFGLKQQQDDFLAVKQKLVNVQEALDSSSSLLDELEISPTTFDTMVTSKQKDLTRTLSKELELVNVVALVDNSQRILGENSFNVISVCFQTL